MLLEKKVLSDFSRWLSENLSAEDIKKTYNDKYVPQI